MHHLTLAASLAMILPCFSTAVAQTALTTGDCTELLGELPAGSIGLPSGPAKVVSASFESAKPLALAERGPTPAARVQPAQPDFCKLIGEIGPVDPKAPPIRFQVNLPVRWNGKALQFGGGGFNGVLITGLGLPPATPLDRPGPLALGYVTYGTDSGHETKPGEPVQAFAANDEAFLNFAHASYKKVRDVAVSLAEKAYGQKPRRIYFAGSSEGGREALTMAQRYPADFDGVFARVPVINWTGLQHAGFFGGMATMGDGWLNPELVKFVHEETLKACDGLDGAADRVIANPSACLSAFKPSSLKCQAGQPATACLNDKQIRAIETLRSPYRLPFPVANGLDDYPAWGIGGEGLPGVGATGGWSAWWTGTSAPTWPLSAGNARAWEYGAGGIAHVFARDPAMDVTRYRPEDHKVRILEVSNLMDSTNPDLAPFHARGGKVIILEYLADYAQSPYAGIRYYENVVKTMGTEKAGQTIRLFAAPGVDHVGTGAPASVDMLAALDTWVEEGKAPANLTVVEQDMVAPAFPVLRSLPLCEWPAWPKYRAGEATQAASFDCVR
ncbi:Tannase/feruloyl esterase [Rhabdaerophilaceae bacterium]